MRNRKLAFTACLLLALATYFAVTTSNVMAVGIGCDCYERANQNCGYGRHCIASTYTQSDDLPQVRTCSCACSGGGYPSFGACIDGTGGIGTYKEANIGPGLY